MKYVIALLLSVSLMFAQVPQFQHKPVNDYANVIPDNIEQQLDKLLIDNEKNTTNVFAVLTVNDMGGMDIETFKFKVFNEWKLGKKGKDNGMLFVLCPTERKFGTEVGYGLEGILTDAYTKLAGRKYFAPYAKQGEPGVGILELMKAYMNETNPAMIQMKAQEAEQQAAREAAERAQQAQSMKELEGVALTVLYGILITAVLAGLFIWYRRKQEEKIQQQITNADNYQRALKLYEHAIGIAKDAAADKIQHASQLVTGLLKMQEIFKQSNPGDGSVAVSLEIIRHEIAQVSHSTLDVHLTKQEFLKTVHGIDVKRLVTSGLNLDAAIKLYPDAIKAPAKPYADKANVLFDQFMKYLPALKSATDKVTLADAMLPMRAVIKEISNFTAVINDQLMVIKRYSDAKEWCDKNLAKAKAYGNDNSNHPKVSAAAIKASRIPSNDYLALYSAWTAVMEIIPREKAEAAEAIRRKRQEEEDERRRAERRRREREEEEDRRRSSFSSYSSGSSFSSSDSGSSSYDSGGGSSGGGGSSDSY